MATLNPAPSSLGLSSPALGPWFKDGTNATPTLAAPAADLSVAVSLAAGMEWRAPAGGSCPTPSRRTRGRPCSPRCGRRAATSPSPTASSWSS